MNPYGPYPGYFPPQHPGYYPNPNAFYGPPYGQTPPHTPTRSTKYPSLHHILAADSTTLKPDLRQKPRVGMNASTFYAYAAVSAMAHPVYHMHLISKAFPWSIDIKSNTQPITCEAVWDALYSALQEHLADSEWGMVVVGDKKKREAIEKAAKKRVEGDPDKALKRIDWLGDETIFRGLEKVEDLQKHRLLPGTEACAETWVVKISD